MKVEISDYCVGSLVNFQMNCCGVYGYWDFSMTHSDDWRKPGLVSTKLDAPIICCVKEPLSPSKADTSCARKETFDIHTQVI